MVGYFILGALLGLLVVISFVREKNSKEELKQLRENSRDNEIKAAKMETEFNDLKAKAELVETLRKEKTEKSEELEVSKAKLISANDEISRINGDVHSLREENLKQNKQINDNKEQISQLEIEKATLVTAKKELQEKADKLPLLEKSDKDKSVVIKEISTQLDNSVEQLKQVRDDLEKRKLEIKDLNNKLTKKLEEFAILETTLEEERKQTEEKLQLLDESKENMKHEFQVLANKIFEEKSEKLSSTSKESLDSVLKPLKEQLTQFKTRVNDIYDKESEERGFLKKEISDLKKLNERISEDAINLTSALKGDKKSQGTWGEIQLQNLLEHSGLIEGSEYELQVSQRDEMNSLFFLDAVIHLPQNRDIIIDSKVSLVDYTDYYRAENQEEKDLALKRHINALRTHIKQLSDKNYQKLPGINTLEYVIMFLPIEAAYITAIKEDPNLLEYALGKNITLICPSTLLITLKTVHNIWKYEKQNKNAKDIAIQGQKVYDKLVVFLESFKKIGNSLKSASDNYENGMKQLVHGRGNLISGFEKMKELGVQPKKSIDSKLIDEAKAEAEVSALIGTTEEKQADE